MCQLLHFREGHLPVMYLGLLLVSSIVKKVHFTSLRESVLDSIPRLQNNCHMLQGSVDQLSA